MISGTDRLAATPAHRLALDCIEAAIGGAAPATATRAALSLDGDTLRVGGRAYDLSEYGDVLVVGGGKAGEGVTRALESVLGERITGGLVVTKTLADFERVRGVVGTHPLPSAANVEATDEILETVERAGEDTLVLFVLTGGASALLTAPAGDLALEDLRETTERLLEGGVPIDGINAVRKHLSRTKGGRIARAAAPATVVSLLLSDVVGNDRSTIGSGPTVPDGTTYDDALATFERHGIEAPEAVRTHLEAGAAGDIGETPFPDDPAFSGVENVLVGDNRTALDAAAETAEEAGYDPIVLSSRLRGEASEVAKPLVAVAEEAAATGTPVDPPAVVLAGGECTVSVSGDGGEGGPNQELALSAAIEGAGGGVVAAVDTDGEDGSSDAAGAIVDGGTVTDRGRASSFLAANDAGSYLSEVGALIETGPTGTNVNDVAVAVVPEADD
jgi:hydroxypyruvate reductase